MGYFGSVTDITEQRRAQAENRKLHEEMLRIRDETLRALSTPLIPIADGVVAMPLIGRVDSYRAQQVIESMLRGVVAHQARTAILDLTGVPVADNEVVNTLVQTAKMVRLLGAEVVLTGIRPELASTLLELEGDLKSMVTRRTLQDGIAYALRQ